MKSLKLQQLQVLSAKIRIDILKMIEKAGQGHIGGALSIVDVLSVLYGKQLQYNPKRPHDHTRDMVILSKGHAGAAWYSALANVGFFDKEVLMTLNIGGTRLPSHPDRNKIPGVDMTTGSLGQGISVAAGIAKGIKLQKNCRYVYVIVGDGEVNEGQCWEAFQFIAHYQLDNCIVIIDENKKQIDGETKDVINPFDLCKKMEAFGFSAMRVNGGNLEDIDAAITQAKATKNRPTCIVLDTIKGQGVPFYTAMVNNHSVKFSEDVKKGNQKAIKELETFIAEVQ